MIHAFFQNREKFQESVIQFISSRSMTTLRVTPAEHGVTEHVVINPEYSQDECCLTSKEI